MAKKYNTRYEYITEKPVDWIAQFADSEAKKIADKHNISIDEIKNAGRLENILDIVERKKKLTVESKVIQYRQMVGLDLVNNIEKEALKEVKASRIALSSRDNVGQNDTKLFDNIKQYVSHIINNRNGAIPTPAILEQIENYMNVDKDWLRNNYTELEKIINATKENFKPETYHEFQASDLARTDNPSKGEKEPPLFMPPTTTS